MSNLPVEISFNHPKSGYEQLYPYSSVNGLQQTLDRLGMKLPFNQIIDKSMGISTCKECKSKYAGYQQTCEHVGYFHSYGWHDHNYKDVFDRNKNSSWASNHSEGWKTCGNWCEWDLQQQFNEQSEFFKTISIISHVVNQPFECTSPTGIMKYRQYMPVGMAERVDLEYTQREVQYLKDELNQHKIAIQEIVKRMQAAGQVLNVGF